MSQESLAAKQEAKRLKSHSSSRYYKPEEKLNLSWLPDDWHKILLFKNWTSLQTLDLAGSRIGDNDAELISKMQWPELQALDLRYNSITGDGMKHLMNIKLYKLKDLHLSNNQIGDEGVLALSSRYFPRLNLLDLDYNNITGAGFILFQHANFNQLRSLFLKNNKIGSKGSKILGQTDMPELETLDVRGCMLNAQGVKYLTKGRWKRLTRLVFDQISHESWSALATNSWNQIKRAQLHDSSCKIHPISFFCLMISVWSVEPIVTSSNPSSKLKKRVNKVVRNKYLTK